MQTCRRYYDDCYTSRFHAEAQEVSTDGLRVYLDNTYFYPTSGGQPNDRGFIAGLPVVDVIDEGTRIAHLFANPPESPEILLGCLECRLDWPRRYDHMQQHTGQHLLSAVFVEIFALKTLSFHMGEDVSSIELASGKLDDNQIDIVERRANEIVSEAREVRISFEDADEVFGLRKASARTGLLRIITIEDYDRSACGGTHVRTTAEIGPIQIRGLERVRGNIRLEFVCGRRAFRRSKEDFRLLSKLSKANSVPPQALEEHWAALRGRLENAEKSLAKSKLLLAQGEAERLYAETPVSEDGLRRRVMPVTELTDERRSVAIAFANNSKSLMVALPVNLPGPLLIACSADSGLHAGGLWKATFAEGGGRGGGSATLAQGQVTAPQALRRLLSSAGLSLELAADGSATTLNFG